MADLASLSALVDSFASSDAHDIAAQVSPPHLVALHLQSMRAVAALHKPTSPAYERAATVFRSTLDATLAALTAKSGAPPTVLLLALPPYSPPLLRKRAAWLKPFASLSKRYSAATRPSSALAKRALGDDTDDTEGRVQQTARPTPSPVVPTGYICFRSEADLKNQTLACLGRGTGVKGVTVRGTECWVCSCTKTTEHGKTKSWAGQGCEKEDLSSCVLPSEATCLPATHSLTASARTPQRLCSPLFLRGRTLDRPARERHAPRFRWLGRASWHARECKRGAGCGGQAGIEGSGHCSFVKLFVQL